MAVAALSFDASEEDELLRSMREKQHARQMTLKLFVGVAVAAALAAACYKMRQVRRQALTANVAGAVCRAQAPKC